MTQGLPVDVGGTVDRLLDEQIVDKVEREVEDKVNRTVEAIELPALPRDLASGVLDTGDPLKTLDGLKALPGIVTALAGREVEIVTVGDWPVMRDEWVLLASDEEAARVKAAGLVVLEDTPMESIPGHLMVVSVDPEGPGGRRAEALLRELGAELADRNHVYFPAAPAAPGSAATGAAKGSAGRDAYAAVGMIDTDVDETHPALKDLPLTEQDFVTHGTLRPQSHGTAVASILVRELRGLRKDRPVVRAASVFFLSDDGTTGATTASLVRAVDWMISEDVAVINFSLTGPPNKTLETIVKAGQAAGIVFVAAVGNDGPAARPLYPAAYPGVVGVTAVDKDGKIYRWANRGDHIAVAATGVQVEIARPGGGSLFDSGTSFAAPVVSAWMAAELAADRRRDPFVLIEAAARPASKSGRDGTFGYGILAPSRAR
jgi:subtilisin family serine protease